MPAQLETSITSAATCIGRLIASNAQACPGQPALFTARETITYSELLNRALAHETRLRHQTGPVSVSSRQPEEVLTKFLAALLARRPALVLPPGQEADTSLASCECHNGDLLWAYSSGSTGAPKLFARSHLSWLNSFAACEAVFPCRAGDVAALPGSLTHSLFLYGAVHGLARGMSLALCDGFQPKSALRLFQSANATVLYAVPAMLDALLTAGFGPWRPRLIFCGGAKLDPLLRARLQQALSNTDIVEFYGASELSFVSYASSSQPAPEGSVGQAFPGVDIAVRGDDGAELPAGREGLITIRSSLVFSRYPDPAYGDSASIPMPSGWSTAGDMGYLNEHGFLYLTGRMARIVNCKGLKIHPEVIEAVLRSYPGIEAAAAFGVPDAKRGEAIAAVIVPMAGKASPTRKALAEECRARLGRPYTPRLFYQSQSLPMTASGKPAYGQLRDSLIQGEAQFTPLT